MHIRRYCLSALLSCIIVHHTHFSLDLLYLRIMPLSGHCSQHEIDINLFVSYVFPNSWHIHLNFLTLSLFRFIQTNDRMSLSVCHVNSSIQNLFLSAGDFARPQLQTAAKGQVRKIIFSTEESFFMKEFNPRAAQQGQLAHSITPASLYNHSMTRSLGQINSMYQLFHQKVKKVLPLCCLMEIRISQWSAGFIHFETFGQA